MGFLASMGLNGVGTFVNSNVDTVINSVIEALETPGRFPQRQPLDDVESICGL